MAPADAHVSQPFTRDRSLLTQLEERLTPAVRKDPAQMRLVMQAVQAVLREARVHLLNAVAQAQQRDWDHESGVLSTPAWLTPRDADTQA